MRPLTYKQRLFVEFCQESSSSTPVDAARRAGYCRPDLMGPRLARNPRVQAAIQAGEATAATPAREVLARMSEIASADMLDFVHINERGESAVDLTRAKRLGLGHMIQRLRMGKNGLPEIELVPKLPCLLKLGEHYKLWKGDVQPQVTLVDLAKGLRAKYEKLRLEGRVDEDLDGNPLRPRSDAP